MLYNSEITNLNFNLDTSRFSIEISAEKVKIEQKISSIRKYGLRVHKHSKNQKSNTHII